jgi:hypothetical protein
VRRSGQFRQGDVLLIPVRRRRFVGIPVARDGGRVVLAYGEATGHAHAIIDRGAELFQTDLGERFLQVLATGGVSLTHEEHADIVLPRGLYEVVRQREYDQEEIRQVLD